LKNKEEFFPINTATACPLKWNWNTLFLSSGESSSCHRASTEKLTSENFFNFHNSEEKIAARKKMLEGVWPGSDNEKYSLQYCGFCRKIEDNGGFSDRQYHLTLPSFSAPELKNEQNSVIATPTTLEVFFNNTCNLSCNYCQAKYSSKIQNEENIFGHFFKDEVKIEPFTDKVYTKFIPLFWKWFELYGQNLHRLGVLGGEPFLQKELQQLIDIFEKNPNQNLEFNLISNLSINHDIFVNYIQKIKKLVKDKKIKRFDLVCSIDCWGSEQEYVRLGLNMDLWLKNFEYALKEKWIYLCTNSIVTPLTLKTMPELFLKLNYYKKHRKIHQQIGYIQGPDYWKPEIFGGEFFKQDIESILHTMPENNDEEIIIKKYMDGILNVIRNSTRNDYLIRNFLIFLKEKDRRRNTNYKNVFPWLIEFDIE
jgi:pyruvate-formate lyase-activating enzyme